MSRASREREPGPEAGGAETIDIQERQREIEAARVLQREQLQAQQVRAQQVQAQMQQTQERALEETGQGAGINDRIRQAGLSQTGLSAAQLAHAQTRAQTYAVTGAAAAAGGAGAGGSPSLMDSQLESLTAPPAGVVPAGDGGAAFAAEQAEAARQAQLTEEAEIAAAGREQAQANQPDGVMATEHANAAVMDEFATQQRSQAQNQPQQDSQFGG